MSERTGSPQPDVHAKGAHTVDPNNRVGLDYRAESRRLGAPPCPIIDGHAHIGGDRAAQLYLEVANLFGIERVHSMTQLEDVPRIREILGDRVQFIAVPNWNGPDRREELGVGFLDRIERFHDLGARIVKFFAAPRVRDTEAELGEPGLFRLDSPLRIQAAQLAERLGMAIMVHVADPDTWFASKYTDRERYGTKREQYEPLERMLERFGVPWIAAHMGGSPEHLDILDELLERHRNLHLDTSACKWMLRELGAQPTADVRGFFLKWRTRLLFGSDILTMEAHLEETNDENVMASKASGLEQAFTLYASRYWAFRMLFEGTGRFESPIADPDLHMIDPDGHAPTDAPDVTCHGLDPALLRDLYRKTATTIMNSLVDA